MESRALASYSFRLARYSIGLGWLGLAWAGLDWARARVSWWVGGDGDSRYGANGYCNGAVMYRSCAAVSLVGRYRALLFALLANGCGRMLFLSVLGAGADGGVLEGVVKGFTGAFCCNLVSNVPTSTILGNPLYLAF